MHAAATAPLNRIVRFIFICPSLVKMLYFMIFYGETQLP